MDSHKDVMCECGFKKAVMTIGKNGRWTCPKCGVVTVYDGNTGQISIESAAQQKAPVAAAITPPKTLQSTNPNVAKLVSLSAPYGGMENPALMNLAKRGIFEGPIAIRQLELGQDKLFAAEWDKKPDPRFHSKEYYLAFRRAEREAMKKFEVGGAA